MNISLIWLQDVRYIGRYDWAYDWDKEFEDKFYEDIGIENPENVPQPPLSEEEQTALNKFTQSTAHSPFLHMLSQVDALTSYSQLPT